MLVSLDRNFEQWGEADENPEPSLDRAEDVHMLCDVIDCLALDRGCVRVPDR